MSFSKAPRFNYEKENINPNAASRVTPTCQRFVTKQAMSSRKKQLDELKKSYPTPASSIKYSNKKKTPLKRSGIIQSQRILFPTPEPTPERWTPSPLCQSIPEDAELSTSETGADEIVDPLTVIEDSLVKHYRIIHQLIQKSQKRDANQNSEINHERLSNIKEISVKYLKEMMDFMSMYENDTQNAQEEYKREDIEVLIQFCNVLIENLRIYNSSSKKTEIDWFSIKNLKNTISVPLSKLKGLKINLRFRERVAGPVSRIINGIVSQRHFYYN